jgi:hypothetical protein
VHTLIENQALVVDQAGDGDDPLLHSHITSLGQLLSVLPLDLDLGRFIAIGARAGRFIMHAIVIAAGSALQDIFVRPHPYSSPAKFFELVG